MTAVLSAGIEKVTLQLRLELDTGMSFSKRKRGIKDRVFGASSKVGQAKQNLAEKLRLEHQAWFSGTMTKNQCDHAVLAGKHGDFLIYTRSVLVYNDLLKICVNTLLFHVHV